MGKLEIDSAALDKALKNNGLICMGGLSLQVGHCPEGAENLAGRSALLIGNAGSAMWQYFRESPEFKDGEADPMDRWTRRVLASLARSMVVDMAFPFEKPYWPFQRIAGEVTGGKPSPIGIVIHETYGLWHALRGLMILPESHSLQSSADVPSMHSTNHPCDSCMDKPCLSACPVGAFSGSGFDVVACRSHLASGNEPDCSHLGCRARAACPVGTGFTYEHAHMVFHMRAFKR